jgi:hypothetical protein
MSSSSNVSTVDLTDGRTVCLSYGVPVAVFVPAGYVHTHPASGPLADYYAANNIPVGYFKTDKHYSSTSSKHANAFARDNGRTAAPIPHQVFAALVAPLTIPR